MSREKYIVLAALLVLAVLSAVAEFAPRASDARPDRGLSLRGKFIGPNAAQDARVSSLGSAISGRSRIDLPT
ncbi:hypothetical protein EBS40_08135 [bacterium]|nr:hypothetical protein [bacterium]